MSMRSIRLSRLFSALLLPACGAAVVLAVWWSELPAEVAVHWNSAGEPDGFASPSAAAALIMALIVGLGVLSMNIAAMTPPSSPGGRWGPATVDAATWAITAILTSAIVDQRAGTEPTTLQGWWFLLALPFGAAGAWAGRGRPAATSPPRHGGPPADAPRLDPAPTGPTWWVGRASIGSASIASLIGLIALGLVLAASIGWWVAAVHFPVALLAIAFCSARVTIGTERIVIAGGLAGWPRIRVDLGSVASADVTTIRLLTWGIGFRIKRGATGYITRGGDALEISRTDGSRVVVTVDDAQQAAATVNSLVARADQVG